MKRIYFVFALALMAIIGSSVAWAAYVPSEDSVEEVQDGDVFYLRGDFMNGTEGLWIDVYRWLGVQYPKITEQHVMQVRAVDNNPGETFIFTVESSGTEVNGHKGFYLKNVSTGMYVMKDKAEGAFKQAELRLVSSREEATVFAFSYVTDMYEIAPEGVVQLICYANDGTTVLYLNNNFNGNKGIYTPKMSTFTDGTTWFSIIPAEEGDEEVAIIDQMMNLSSQLEVYYPALGGNAPGYYPVDVAEEFNAAFVECNVDEIIYGDDYSFEKLVAARDRLEAIAVKILQGPQQVEDGAYYYVNSAYEWVNNPEDVRAIFANNNNHEVYWGKLNETDAKFIWKFTKKGDNLFVMTNYETGENVITVTNNGTSTLGFDETKQISVNSLGNGQYNLVLGTSTNNAMHPKGHNNGEGTSGAITGFPGGLNTQSAWRFQPVASTVIDSLEAIVAREKEAIALHGDILKLAAEVRQNTLAAFEYVISDEARDVTPMSGDDFESNAAMSAEHGKSWGNDGQGYEALVDGNFDTFFHTCWTGALINSTSYDADGNPTGTYTTLHNLGMMLAEPVSNVAFELYARQDNYNNPTKVDVEVSEDGVNWKTIFYGYDFFTPTTDPSNPYIIGPFELGDSYQYVRFANYMNDRSKNGRFFCISEIKVYDGVELASTCQASTMDQTVVSNFLKAYSELNRYADVFSGDDLDAMKQAYNNMEAAYANFRGEFADPALLLAAIKSAETTISNFRIGENQIGLYTEDADIDKVVSLKEAGQTLLDNGYYTQQAVDDAAVVINEALAELDEHIILPDPNKWYKFQFANADEYVEFKYPEGDRLLDHVCAVATDYITIDEGEGEVVFHDDLMEIEGTSGLYSALEDNVPSPDLYSFRFIPVEGGYVIQNKATGLFLENLGWSSLAHVTTKPGLFKVMMLGAGFCVLESFDLQTGLGRAESTNTLHFANPAQWCQMRGWPDHRLGSKSATKIIETGDVVDESEIGPCYRYIDYEVAEIVTFNAGISSVENVDMYSLVGSYRDDDLTYVGMLRTEKAAAGEPVVLMGLNDLAGIYFSSDISKVALTKNGLVGTLVNLTLDEKSGAAVLVNNEGTMQWEGVKDPVNVQANTGYLDGKTLRELTEEEYDDLCYEIIGILITDFVDGIRKPVGTSWTPKDVYDLQGHRVASTDNLNGLLRGLYIINGKKVLIP